MKKILETDRIYLRELTLDDFNNISETLKDELAMYAYEHAFSDDEVMDWLKRQLFRYEKYGFGLWAVIDKENDIFLGQAGLTMQPFEDFEVLEIGYLLCRKYWHKGYATEAACALKKYAFEVLKAKDVYSIIRDNNYASIRVAERNGMSLFSKINKYYYETNMPHLVYKIENKGIENV